jgi:hypothetical protein
MEAHAKISYVSISKTQMGVKGLRETSPACFIVISTEIRVIERERERISQGSPRKASLCILTEALLSDGLQWYP